MKLNYVLRIQLLLLMVLFSVNGVKAIPADPSLRHRIVLTDGSIVEVQLVGDEWFSYYRDASGNVYTLEQSTPSMKRYAKRDKSVVEAGMRRAAAMRVADAHNVCGHPYPVLPTAKRKTMNSSSLDAFRGSKRGLIIMVNFQDVSYVTPNPKNFYNKVANQLNFSQGNYKLSIRDYFLKQSYGRFDLQFDIIGPVTVSQDMEYYGAQEGSTHDVRAAEMVKEAIELVADSVNFSDYDWDNDGEVDNVFVLFAGHNQAEGAGESTIWPHKWSLSSGVGSALTLQGMRINTYACSSEMRGSSGKVNCGIGTFCHEFSHCMGFPDLYDTSYSGNIGVGTWDIMGSGSYRQNGFNPMDYSGFERWTAGWLEPIELTDPVVIENMKPIEENGEMYYIDCESPTGQEYYILENRDVTNMYAYGHHPRGLLISHIDYNYYAWYYNKVNTFGSFYEYDYNQGKWISRQNNHMRWQVIPADNNMQQYTGQTGDVYPYTSGSTTNNSLDETTTPKMVRYNSGENALDFADHGISNITRNADGTISFSYRNGTATDNISYKSLYLDERVTAEQVYDGGVYNVNSNIMFPNGHWRTVWLPFNMTREELKEALGDNVEVAYFNNVNINGTVMELNFKTVQTGIIANQPCLIKVNTTDWDYTELGLLMQKLVNPSTNAAQQQIGDYTFKGQKSTGQITIAHAGSEARNYPYYESAPKTWPDTETVKAYEAYFSSSKRDKIDYTYDKIVTSIDGVENDVDGINVHNVYDLKGNIVKKNAKNTQGLTPGTYIFGGKKVLVK